MSLLNSYLLGASLGCSQFGWSALGLLHVFMGHSFVAGLTMERVLGVDDLCDLITQSFPFSLP